MAEHLLLPVLLNRKQKKCFFYFRNHSEGGVHDSVECVTCHVECATVGSCTVQCMLGYRRGWSICSRLLCKSTELVIENKTFSRQFNREKFKYPRADNISRTVDK